MSNGNIVIHRFRSWNEFKVLLRDRLPHNDQEYGISQRYLFRGAEDSDWSLKSSFEREFEWRRQGGNGLRKCSQLLNLFRENCAADPDLEPMRKELFEWLALARHHKLPTPILDWSESPYVAAYFAYSEALCKSPVKDVLETLASSNKMVAIWALDRSNDSFWWINPPEERNKIGQRSTAASTKNDEKVIRHWLDKNANGPDLQLERIPVDRIILFKTSERYNERLSRQRGWLTYQVEDQDPLDKFVAEAKSSGPVLWKFELPLKDAPLAMSDLHDMRINSKELMPDLDGRAKHALARAILEIP